MRSSNLRHIGVLQVLSRVYALGRQMHPGKSPGAIKLNLQMLGNAVSHRDTIAQWYGTLDNPLLTRAVERYPLI